MEMTYDVSRPSVTLISLLILLTPSSLAISESGVISTTDTQCENNDYNLMWNAALCKPTSVSSVHKNWTSDLVVDGNKNGNTEDNSCFHTQPGQNEEAWLIVDLVHEYLIHRVAITNRNGAYAYRTKDIDILLYLTDPRDDSEFPYNNNGRYCADISTAVSGTESYDCESPTYARYVKLLKGDLGVMNFCEVEVIVSRKKHELPCSVSPSKLFEINREVTADNGQVLETLSTASSHNCMVECLVRSQVCNGWDWTPDTGVCHILTNVGMEDFDVVVKTGTNLYVEIPVVRSLSDGSGPEMNLPQR